MVIQTRQSVHRIMAASANSDAMTNLNWPDNRLALIFYKIPNHKKLYSNVKNKHATEISENVWRIH